MSDIFKLPMICEDGDGYIYSQDCRHSIKFDDTDTNCLEQKTFVANAINSHDKLTEQNKMLREALILSDAAVKNLLPLAEGGVIDCAEYFQSMLSASYALEATK
ncbi:hypothetical protein S140_50 [Shewanella sp. phage 1/40]|uniref:hypothetical protein n=1 Tax=Shewanella sp. phage 1/40 TaxID=1458860 RepID=UPI0004F8C7D6|nr:hypothetical protein S140_50 [Shewanella sp. phage 1/40]AHK11460.1 hypothetical protein S140_50 [Shewanella sp. phage 1/40]